MAAFRYVIAGCSQTVAQAFQPVQMQAEACGCIFWHNERTLAVTAKP
jgi:hypothetical protein